MAIPPPTVPPAKYSLGRWIETRFPLAAVIRWGSVEGIAGGSRFSYALGSTTLALFLLLVFTGIWQLLYYVPTVDHAYTSLMYLRLQVPLGWLVHGLHYWSAQAFIVVMGLHVLRVFVWAAYKKPRELIWILGVVLLLGAAFIFTGAILPWDTLGYWAGEVGTNMAGTVPVIGNFLKLLMCGGDAMGQMTLSRAFTVHVAILPILTSVCIALHLVAFRQFGSVGPWNPAKRATTGWFWPDQTFKDLLVVSAVVLALIVLSAFVPAPISGPADPLDSAYTPKPEWNFLFLYEALKAFKGRWEWIGTMVIPAGLVILLFALPFIDRTEERDPFKRPIAMSGGFLFVTAILVLTFIGYRSHSGAEAPPTGAPAQAARMDGSGDHASSPAAEATGPAGPPVKPSAQTPIRAPAPPKSAMAAVAATPAQPGPAPSDPSVRDGRSLFMSVGCIVCHKIDGAGGTLGPDLAHEAQLGRTSAWLDTQINDPVKHTSPTIMPAYAKLTTSQVQDLADFILAVRAAPPAPPPQVVPGSANPAPDAPGGASTADAPKTTAASSAKSVSDGKPLFASAGCAVCHKIAGTGGVLGPDLSHEGALGRSSQWLIAQITDPRKHAPLSIMPATTTLTPAQLASLAGFILGATASPPVAAAGSPSPSPPGTTPQVAPVQPQKGATSSSTLATVNSSGTEAPAAGALAPAARVDSPGDQASPSAANVTVPADPAAKSSPGSSVRASERPESSAAAVAATHASPGPAPSNPSVRDGRSLFMSVGCIVCHKIDGAGGTLGPDLSHEAQLGRTSAWLDIQINDPVKHTSPTIMPAYAKLTTSQVQDLADFILAVRAGPASSPVAASAAAAPPAPPPQAGPGSANPAPDAPGAASTADAPKTTAASSAKGVSDGMPLFTSAGCAVCHKIAGIGGVLGPDLSHEAALGRTSQWLMAQITDPKKHAPLSIMPATTTLTPAQLASLAGFILGAAAPPAAVAAGSPAPSPTLSPSHPGAASPAAPVQPAPQQRGGAPSGSTPAPVSHKATVMMIGDPQHGAILFAQSCAQCHGAAGVGHIGNTGSLAGVVSPLAPIATTLFNEDPVVFAGNIDLFIQHGATPPGPHPALIMPAFGDTHALTEQMIANIDAYVLALNGVDEARIVDPGITPVHAAEGAAALFALALAVVGVLYLRKRN